MGSKNCMNEFCRATTSSEWKKGWSLRSGGFATLCFNCGSAYEKSAFCENFHAEESGWRDCRICGKLIHCGCIASRYLHEYMDFRGIGCISCVKRLEMKSVPSIQIPGDIPNRTFLTKNIRDVNPSVLENRINDDKFSTDRLLQLTRAIGVNDVASALEQVKRKEPMLKTGESSNDKFSTDRPLQLTRAVGVNDVALALEQVKRKEPMLTTGESSNDKFSTDRPLQLTRAVGVNDVALALEQVKRKDTMLKTGESSKNYSNLVQPSSSAFAKAGNIKPKQVIKDTHESTPQPSLNFSLTTSLVSSSPVLPFPSGAVEASDQSKGSCRQQGPRARHILPKPSTPNFSTAMETNKEAVSQTRVARPPTDGRGRNQLLPRYWPRITDQELQQLSGDLKSTIVPLFEKILSASDAGRIGRLVLPKACAEAYFPSINQAEGIPIRIQDIKGKEWTFQFRFWPNNNSRMYVLEGITPCIQNMQLQAGDTVIFSRIDPGSQLVIGGRKASNNVDVQDAQTPSVQNNGSPGETSFSGVNDNVLSNGFRMSDDSLQRAMSEKKKARNIKNKRLLMHSDDAVELRITWEEAQDLFRPSPSSEPTVCMVEDHEFEEFEEPPIFGKRTIFTSRLSGEQEQLAQCDSCLKWRRLPLRALLSARWTCSENIWDPKRSSCSAPEDINPRNFESFFSINKDSKKRRTPDNKLPKEGEPSGLDALATAAVLGDNIVEMAGSSVGATTRHPRHRRGCSCIVCIQPPSGKGRHESSCQCNVCLTVKRRFKTLMMRKKKRQSDLEAELALEKEKIPIETGLECDDFNENENEMDHKEKKLKLETNEGLLDLNCDPHREDDILAEAAGQSLTTLMNAASLPLDMYLGQNGSPGLGPTPVASRVADEGGLDSRDVEPENAGKDGEQ